MLNTQMESGTQVVKRQQPTPTVVQDLIVWGIDLEFLDPHELERMNRFLASWESGRTCRVQPVSVLTPVGLFRPRDLALGSLPPDMREAFLARFRELLGHLKSKALREPVIVEQPGRSLGERARLLIDFASQEGAQFIAINTRARKGWERWGLGSFAEAVIASSPIPVLTINPKTEVPARVSKILFATDFSRRSRQAYLKVLDWAVKMRAEVVVLHCFENAYPPELYGGVVEYVDEVFWENWRKTADRRCRAHVRSWLKIAQTKSVPCEVVVSREPGTIEDAILLTAQDKKASVIAVTTHRGAMGQRFLGSVAREVLTTAPCPVAVVHASAARS